MNLIKKIIKYILSLVLGYEYYEKKIFLDWVLTAKYHNYCEKWEKFFRENKYKGEYYWTFV